MRQLAFTAASGTYDGSGTRCATVTCAPQEVAGYVNEQGPVTAAAIAGPSLKLADWLADWLADDLTLDTVAQLDLVLYNLAIFGNGGAACDVTATLYDGCPGTGR